MLCNVFLVSAAMLVCCGPLASGLLGSVPPVTSENPRLKDWFNTTKHGKIELPKEDLDLLETVLGILNGTIPWDFVPGTRRECRTLPDDQRRKLFQCFEQVANSGKMAAFEAVHRFVVAPNAHGGPCFPSWHKLYLQMVEIALQNFCNDSTIYLCYWDVTLDQLLPNPCESVVFTAEYFGNENGPVTTGPYANKQCLPDCLVGDSSKLARQCGGDRLTNGNEAAAIINAPSYAAMAGTTAQGISQVEDMHGYNHMFVGGQMSDITCSPSDLIFFLYHCFIDMLVHSNLERRKANIDQEYPWDLFDLPFHWPSVPLLPFLYRSCVSELRRWPEDSDYAPQVIQCKDHGDCKSKVLWCNGGKCTACVRGGAKMEPGWPGRACFIENCNNPVNAGGVCACG